MVVMGMRPIPHPGLDSRQAAAVEAIFRARYPQMLQTARNIVGSRADAEDVLSDAFQGIILNIDKIAGEPEARQYAYCAVAVRHRAYRLCSDRKREAALREQLLAVSPRRCDPLEEAMRRDDLNRLTRALQQLPREDRRLVLLRFGRRLPYGEIALLLGVRRDTAQKRGRRVLKKLLAALEEGDC